MTARMIDKEMFAEIGRYLFDGFLVALVWSKSNVTLLSENALWTETFGEYANATKTTFQVIITLIIAVTAFYRMLREIRKYRHGKKNKE